MIDVQAVDYGFINALVSGGISLVSGLFGRKKDKPQVTTTSHEVDLGRLVSESIANGFNPRSILNAGGLSAYTKTTSTGTGGPGSGGTSAIGHIANAAGTAFNVFREDAAAKQAALSVFPDAPTNSMSSALGWSRAPAMGRTVSSVPSIKQGGGTLSASKGLVMTGGNSVVKPEAGGQVKPTYEAPTITNPYQVGGGLVDPGFVDAEMYETRNGDSILNYPYMLRVKLNDEAYNFTGLTNKQRADQWKRDPYGLQGLAKTVTGVVVKYGLPALGLSNANSKKEADAIVDPFGGPNSVRNW